MKKPLLINALCLFDGALRRPLWPPVISLLFLAVALPRCGFSQGAADLHVVARTGQAGLTTINNSVSINNAGLVAFSGITADGRGSFVADANGPRPVRPINSSTLVAANIQLNDAGTLVARRGSFFLTVDPVWYYVPYIGWILISPGYSDSYDFVQTWTADGLGNMNLIAEGRSRTDAQTFQTYKVGPFSSVGWDVTINNLGQVAFLADQGSGFTSDWVLATPNGSAFSTYPAWGGASPMLADDGHVVFRSGSAANSSILLLSYDFTSGETIASSAMGFTSLGRMPGISDDGQYVAFYGDLSSAGAGALGTTAGPGVFLSYRASGLRRTIRLAGLTNSASTALFNGFDGNQRVGVNRQAQDGKVFTVFAGINPSGVKGVWVSAWTPTNSSTSELVGVFLQSDLVDGIGPFDDLRLGDPLDTFGQVAFWAKCGNGQAVLQKLLRSGPSVSNVTAQQRQGTNLVEITYTLADPDSSALTVSLAVSANGGASYDLPASSYTGAVGSGLAPGANKKIIWNAGADWPNHFSRNVCFQVTAQEEAPPRASTYAYSSPTTVDTGTNMLTVSGQVFDASTRQPLGGASVALAGQMTATAFDGRYALSNLNLSIGSTLSASKSNYATYSGSVPVPAGATAVVMPDILLQPTSANPVVTGIKPKYDGLFLSGASILNEYTATVNWTNRTPSRVDFYVNGTLSQSIPTSTTEATASLDMGWGFFGSLSLGANKVKVVAVDSLGVASAPFEQPVSVIPMPSFLASQGIMLPFEFIPGNQPAISWEFNFPRSFVSAKDVQQLPFIGKFGPDFDFNIAFDYDLLEGRWGLFAGKKWENRLSYRSGQRPHSTPLNPKFYLGNVDIDYGFGGIAEGVASQTRGIVVEDVGLELKADVRAEILTFYFTDYVPAGGLVRLLDNLKWMGVDINSIQRVRVYGLFDADFKATANLQPALQFGGATLNLKPGVEALYEPDLRVVRASIGVGGNLAFDLQLAPKFGLDKVTGAIYLKLKFEAWLMEPYEQKFLILNGTVYQRSGAAPALALERAESGKILLGSDQWVVYQVKSDSTGLVRRDYLKSGGEQFVANAAPQPLKLVTGGHASGLDAFRAMGQPSAHSAAGTGVERDPIAVGRSPEENPKAGSLTASQADLPICLNVFPGSQPAMDGCGQDLMLLYVTDSGSSNSLQFTDINWTRWDGTNWSVPIAIQTNTQAEFSPVVKYDGNGDAIAVWERVADPNFDQTNLTAMAAQMDLAWARWDHTTKTWSQPAALLPPNSVLDFAPLLCGPMTNGDVLLVWTRDNDNQLMSTNPAQNQIGSKTWSRAAQSWVDTGWFVTGQTYRVSQSLAGAGNHAVYAWTRDLDGILTNDTDQEMFYCEWSNGGWGAVKRFTTNSVADKNVRVAVSPAADVYLVWQQGTNLMMNENFSANTSLVRADSQTAGFADYALAFGPAGNLVLIWQELSPEGSDAYYSVYDPASGTWSKDSRLFQDPPLERSFAPVWDNVGNLTMAYNKVDIVYTNEIITLEGGGSVTVTNVPQAGRVDLYVTKRALIKDVSLTAGDLTVSADNYLPGAAVNITATARNSGDVAVSNMVVGFYDGNPVSGGVLITNVAISGWLEGAATHTVGGLWVVPEPATNHVLYAVVDSPNAITEFDEGNNAQSVSIGGTDMSVSLVSYSLQTNGALRVIAQLQNLGAPSAPKSVLSIRRYGSTNSPLATVAVPSMAPGRLTQVALDLPAGTQPVGEQIYTLTADETHLLNDVDTNNNSSSFAVNLSIDSDGDGMPDDWMIQHFGHATGLASDLSRAQDDADGDGMSNLMEYLAGTDPKNARSYLSITGIGLGGTNGVQIAWGSASNKLYSVQRVVALNGSLGFTNIAEHILSTPPQNVYLDAAATNSPSLFYRVRVE